MGFVIGRSPLKRQSWALALVRVFCTHYVDCQHSAIYSGQCRTTTAGVLVDYDPNRLTANLAAVAPRGLVLLN